MKMQVLVLRTACAIALVALLAPLSPALSQTFEAQPVEAELGPDRDPEGSNKVPPTAGAIRTSDGRVRVLVRLKDAPLATYEGGVASLAPTSPRATGDAKLAFGSPAAVSYRTHLADMRAQTERACQQAAPSAAAFREYDTVFNGFAMVVAEGEVEALAALPMVEAVYPDRMVYASMDASLPLVKAPEFWAELGGRDNAGAGVKVAVIDGGIRPEHPMFSGTGFSYPPGYPLADDYCGSDDPGFCNGKLIAARHFRSIALHPDEFDTPLGANGHGTHVAGTAVGNFIAGATAPDGVPEDISGVAPGAWLMVYKALWWNGTTGSGATSDLIAAVDAAVADGADVINNSWGGGGGEDPADDAFGPAFEAANAAGVVTVAAAGNSGPGEESIGCPGCHPVVFTVANSTTNRLHALGFDLTSPAGGPMGLPCLEGTGPVLGSTVGPQPVVYAGSVGDPEGCSAFPGGSMAGATALISRGSCSFAIKAANAAAAGANFMVVFNNVGGAPITMGGLGASTISSCMIGNSDGIAASDFVVANPGAEGVVNYPAARQTNDLFQDNIASSSSRGPNGDPDFLKPDIAAPGTRIMSAWSVDHPTGGSEYILINGTSMASPHVAGAAALMLQKHPDWSPEQIKSAIMSTSVRGLVKEDAVTPADPFDRGAGRLDLDRARRAGATFDLASMAEDQCFLNCTFTRTIQNELPKKATWYASVESVDPDLGITVTPDKVRLDPGESATFEVTVDTILVDQNQWQFGGVIWSDKKIKDHDSDSDSDSDSDVDSDSDSDSDSDKTRPPHAYLPIAVFASNSTDSAQLTKSVDKALAEQKERLTYDIQLSNLTLTAPIDLVDPIPAGTSFVPGSASALVNGVPDPSFVYDSGSDSMTWSGVLDSQTLEFVPGLTPFGYVPLSIFFAPLTCSSVCDDTSITLSGFPAFDYAGASYNSVVMSSNGFFVVGGDATNASTPFNQNVPDAALPNNVIAPLWTDLDLDGTSPTDSGAGNLYAGLLSSGPFTWLVLEWEGAELFGLPGSAYTSQVWIELGSSNISVVYASLSPGIPGFLTVGVEDAAGLAGSSRYFDGAGTPPSIGAGGELVVDAQPGGVAQFTFQVDASCSLDPAVNVVDVTSGADTVSAFAVTEIVPLPGGDDDSDSDNKCKEKRRR